MSNNFDFFTAFNYVSREDVKRNADCELVVGDMYAMLVDGRKCVRVLLISPAEMNENQENRAHVVVLENNPYVRAGAECRPLAFTLHKLP